MLVEGSVPFSFALGGGTHYLVRPGEGRGRRVIMAYTRQRSPAGRGGFDKGDQSHQRPGDLDRLWSMIRDGRFSGWFVQCYRAGDAPSNRPSGFRQGKG